MLGIVSSTGGPNALVQLLCGLGANFPLPIALVQHITPSFLEGFVAWLGKGTPFDVHTVKSRTVPEPGRVYVAARGLHLRARADALYADAGDPVSAQRPSGTVLLRSIAAAWGHQALGVLLTGMGDDGAAGGRDVLLPDDRETQTLHTPCQPHELDDCPVNRFHGHQP